MGTLAKWSKAPKWAKWFAVDAYGSGAWFERKPQRAGDCWCMGGKEEHAGKFDVGQNWRAAIEKRPYINGIVTRNMETQP